MQYFILSLILLFTVQSSSGQHVMKYSFNQTNYSGKGEVQYSIDYNVFSKGDDYLVLSEFQDISYDRSKGKSFMYVRNPANGKINKLRLSLGKAKWEPTGVIRSIEGIECREYNLKFGKVKGSVFCAVNDMIKIPYFSFDNPDYYFDRSSMDYLPENLPGAILAYDLFVPYIGYLKGNLSKVQEMGLSHYSMPYENIDEISIPAYITYYKNFRDGLYNKTIEIGQQATNFSVLNLELESVALSEYKGKLVFLNFWATWCGGCVAELPQLNKLVQEYKGKDIVFLAFTEDLSVRVSQFLKERNFDFEHFPNTSNVKNMYGARPLPRSVLIDQEGKIAAIFDHPLAPQFGGIERMKEEVKLAKATIDGLLNDL